MGFRELFAHPATQQLAQDGVRFVLEGIVQGRMQRVAAKYDPRREYIERLEAVSRKMDELAARTAGEPKPVPERAGKPEAESGEARPVGTACVPCSVAHLATATGLMKEALRFAREEGMVDPEVRRRLLTAKEEIGAMEREDLTPQNLRALPEEERAFIEEKVMPSLRKFRQDLITCRTVDRLKELTMRGSELSDRMDRLLLRIPWEEVRTEFEGGLGNE